MSEEELKYPGQEPGASVGPCLLSLAPRGRDSHQMRLVGVELESKGRAVFACGPGVPFGYAGSVCRREESNCSLFLKNKIKCSSIANCPQNIARRKIKNKDLPISIVLGHKVKRSK